MTFLDLIQEKGLPDAQHTPRILVQQGKKGAPGVVRVTVGDVEQHPDTQEHHIAWIELYGVKKDGSTVVKLMRVSRGKDLCAQQIRLRVNRLSLYSSFCALAYCNVHGVWGNSTEVPAGAGDNVLDRKAPKGLTYIKQPIAAMAGPSGIKTATGGATAKSAVAVRTIRHAKRRPVLEKT